jgi:ABC-type branched-subunit amino acid transport system ATPase component/ABC-type branched-subunit amino acid transport system permease subunit
MNDRLAARRTIAAALVFGITVALYPLLLSDSYHLGIGITAGAMAASTVGVVLLLGLAHQLAIGQAAFSMIGGYSNAILCVDYGWDPFAALVVGAVLTMILAYVVAAPILKLRGFVLVMATLALHLMLIVFAVQVSFTGGSPGITGLPKFAILGWSPGSDLGYYYTTWIIAFITVWIGININRSRIGRALRAIAASEDAAGSVGIDINRYKVQIFVIGAGMASLTGSLIAHYLRAIDPTVFAFNYSLNLVTGVIVGGLMSVWGGALGAVIIVGLREILRDLSLPLWEAVIMGGLTVVILIAFPRGIAGFIGSLFDRFMGERVGGRITVAEPGAVALEGSAAPPQAGVMLEVDAADRSFGSLHAVNQVSFTVEAGSITALIGPNGAGKTTLFNLIGGYQPLDSGSVRFCGRSIERLLPMEIAGLGIGRTFQNLQLFDNMSVLENVMCGHHRLASTGILAISVGLPRVAREEAAMRRAARDSLAFVGLGGAEAYTPSALAFGHQRLVEIARALALRPSLLLMDEPASGLNDTETERLAELILRIAATGITVLLVEHDMRLVMGLADHVVVMDYGEKMAEGPTDRVRADPKVIAAYLGGEAREPAA